MEKRNVFIVVGSSKSPPAMICGIQCEAKQNLYTICIISAKFTYFCQKLFLSAVEDKEE